MRSGKLLITYSQLIKGHVSVSLFPGEATADPWQESQASVSHLEPLTSPHQEEHLNQSQPYLVLIVAVLSCSRLP